MPIFWSRVRPDWLDAGATGSVEVLLGVDEDGAEVEVGIVGEEDLGVCEAEGDKDEAERDDLLRVWLGDAVGVAPTLVDESSVALETRDSNVDVAVLETCAGLVSVVWLVTDAGTSVGAAELSGGAAVAGPNASMR